MEEESSHAGTPPRVPRRPHGAVGRLATWLRHEARAIADVAAFFFLIFLLLQLTRSAILGRFDLLDIDALRAVVGSLLVAKAVVIADAFRWVARYDHLPIALSALWKTGVYFGMCLSFEYADSLFEYRRTGFSEATRIFAGRLRTPTFWMLQIWLLALLYGFASGRDLVRRIGKERFLELYFGLAPARRGRLRTSGSAPAGPGGAERENRGDRGRGDPPSP